MRLAREGANLVVNDRKIGGCRRRGQEDRSRRRPGHRRRGGRQQESEVWTRWSRRPSSSSGRIDILVNNAGIESHAGADQGPRRGVIGTGS